MQTFSDFLAGGAWPFLVRGITCLLYCVNERDLRLLVAPHPDFGLGDIFHGGSRGTLGVSSRKWRQ